MIPHDSQTLPPVALRRELGVAGATLLGLGSILGTGIFVSIGTAAGAAGDFVLAAIVLAAGVAVCNGLNSAQLAAAHPVSGGTYEYGYRWLHPSLGFAAGWMFLWAKSASAATAALGFAAYALNLGDFDARWRVPLAMAASLLLTVLVSGGMRRSSAANTVIVAATLGALGAFVAGGVATLGFSPATLAVESPAIVSAFSWRGFLEGCALMFVAYTGYGRVATLGEEIHDPRRNIPRAIVATLVISLLVYVAVGWVAIRCVGAEGLAAATSQQAAPLEIVARGFRWRGAPSIVALGACTAMLGVLLNLVLGLSRVALAMGRRGDLPRVFGRLDERHQTPRWSVWLVGIVITALVGIGNVRTTWSFSAFTVLVYYALTNLAALRLSPEERLYPLPLAWLGLAACLFLAFWVDPEVWLAGLALLFAGFALWGVATRLRRQNR